MSRVGNALSPRVCFVELNHDEGATILVAGSARSGTTWLSEILVEALQLRLVFEPLRPRRLRPVPEVEFGVFVAPDDESDEVARALRRILSGRVRGGWVDAFNTKRVARRRLVKEIGRITNLVPWITRHMPQVPVVYMLRHPVTSAWSAAELGWDPHIDEFLAQDALMRGPLAAYADVARSVARDDTFVLHVLRWCLENAAPLRLLAPGSVHVVFYEDLRADPRGELERLRAYLERFGPARWRFRREPVGMARPSRTDYRHTAPVPDTTMSAPAPLAVPTDRVERALAVVGAFGLGWLYDAGERPLVSADAVLRGVNSTSGSEAPLVG